MLRRLMGLSECIAEKRTRLFNFRYVIFDDLLEFFPENKTLLD